jgi:hypothetical protein
VPRKVFVAGEILTAADVNTNLMDQAVQRFASSGARGSAIPAPTEGMTSYLDDLNRIEVYNGSAWGAVGTILQVASTLKNDAFTTTSTSFQEVTGLNVSITPTSASSKILIFAYVSVGHGDAMNATIINLRRDTTNICQSTGSTSSEQTWTPRLAGTAAISSATITFLDSPASTSAISYNITLRSTAGSAYLNRSGVSNDVRATSSITVMEVAG